MGTTVIRLVTQDFLNDRTRLIVGAEAPYLDSIGNGVHVKKFSD